MPNLRYLDPASTQTLREGIAELKDAEGPEGDAAENLAPELVPQIDAHYAIHVLFACPTDLRGEIAAHVWTALGTTMTMVEMQNVNQHRDHRQVLREIGHLKLLKTWAKSVPLIGSIILRTLRMSRRWPADCFESYLDTSLKQLREDFGIELSNFRRTVRHRRGAGLRDIHRRTA